MNIFYEAQEQAKRKICQYFLNNPHADLPAVDNQFFDGLAEDLGAMIVDHITKDQDDLLVKSQLLEKYLEDNHDFLVSIGLVDSSEDSPKPIYRFLLEVASNKDNAKDFSVEYFNQAFYHVIRNFTDILVSWIKGEMFVNIADSLDGDMEFIEKFVAKMKNDSRYSKSDVAYRYQEPIEAFLEKSLLEEVIGKNQNIIESNRI